jgi:hypothetical protein
VNRIRLNRIVDAALIAALACALLLVCSATVTAADAPKVTDAQRAEYFRLRADAIESQAAYSQFMTWAQTEAEKRKAETEKALKSVQDAFAKLPKLPDGKVYDDRTLEPKDAPKPPPEPKK